MHFGYESEDREDFPFANLRTKRKKLLKFKYSDSGLSKDRIRELNRY